MWRSGVPAAVARGLAALGLVAVGLAMVGTAQAQEAPAFPTALDRATLLSWLSRETDIAPERVVAVTPQALTSIVSTFPAGGGQGPRVVIRAEALNAETFARTGALSWHVSLTADCQNRRVRLGETTGYAQRNLLGDRRTLRAAEAEWRAPEDGTALDLALRAACDPGFKGPFASSAVKVAEAEGETGAGPQPAAPPAAPAAVPSAPPSAPTGAPARTSAPQPPKPAVKAAAPRPVAAPVRASGLAVQIGATPAEADAKALIAGVAGLIGGRPTWIETAEVGGRTWRRALVGGFADTADAARFCDALKGKGRTCFVRAGKPG